MPPVIFAGLFMTLWCWKCTMLILFQNLIIFNPFMPPNARSMLISEFARQCGGVEWREERIESLDRTEIALCVSDMSAQGASGSGSTASRTPVYILYFQGGHERARSLRLTTCHCKILTAYTGNASSLPPRLPDISWVLRRVRDSDEPVHCTTVCLSYRGYWTSHDRPSEKGINKDAAAALQWISELHRNRAEFNKLPRPVVVLWGQSIGCGFATNLAARTDLTSTLNIDALVLETPFTNTRAMLKAIYPQRWLPYQYLWPFLRTHLDSWKNLGAMAQRRQRPLPEVYIVEAAKDELVPQDHGALLEQRSREVGLVTQRRKVRGALHNDVTVRREGKQALAESIMSAIANATRVSKQP
ncbi:alpha/beta superfamily hydrolase [Purpureocillium lavendulum]|uniref:Alpha/beta superfamily hydrolase n=1 Tax=Purpureocillium lavendulum TaxID=1247861 RepID=A0AB34FWP9_9HYPO|nr:alpha/beta superfamily hydrolase [Purpureocillium lavendulum]